MANYKVKVFIKGNKATVNVYKLNNSLVRTYNLDYSEECAELDLDVQKEWIEEYLYDYSGLEFEDFEITNMIFS